jgi:hypothetical protein
MTFQVVDIYNFAGHESVRKGECNLRGLKMLRTTLIIGIFGYKLKQIDMFSFFAAFMITGIIMWNCVDIPVISAVPGVTTLVPESDNVAESGEDSEDEWNYYRVEPTAEGKQEATQPVHTITFLYHL